MTIASTIAAGIMPQSDLAHDAGASAPHVVADLLPRILLVDDEPRLLSSLYELLRERDYHLVTATCGREALEHLTKLKFDLILLDLRLPDLSGHQIMDFFIE